MESSNDQHVIGKYHISHARNVFMKGTEVKTFTEKLRHWSDSKPDKNAFIFLSRDGLRETVTWRELYNNAVQYAKAFVSLGLKEQEIVGITLQNSSTWVYIALGVIFARGIPLGVDFMYSDGSDVIALLKKLERCSLFIIDTVSEVTAWHIFKSFLSSYSKSGPAKSDVFPSLRYLLTSSVEIGDPDILTIEELLQRECSVVKLPIAVPDDIVALFQTSGSTGTPKIVANNHKFVVISSRDSYVDYIFQQNEIVYDDEPFGWAGGSPVFSAAWGKTRVLCLGIPSVPRTHARLVVDAIKQERCTMMSALPPLVREIMAVVDDKHFRNDSEKEEKPLLQAIWSGGQPVTKHLVNCVGKLCNVFINGYGMTETLDPLTKFISNAADFEDYDCGRVMEGFEVKIVNDDGETVPVRTRGELYVRGPMFSGYFNEPEATRAVLTDDGWYKTDDIGYMTEDAEFFVLGRKSGIILSGGLEVVPADIESALLGMPGIRDAVIVPLPDDKLFQVLCACIVVNGGSDVTEDKIRKYCCDLHVDKDLIYTVLPSHYLFFDEFPETVGGKTRRKTLQEEAVRRIQSK